MKKQILILSTIFICTAFGFSSKAQISQGGIPLSFQQQISGLYIPISSYSNPDWQSQLEKEKEISPERQFIQPLVAGLNTPTDFGFPNSGSFHILPNGQKIWQGIVSIENAPSIGLLFDNFKLPKGVKLFLTNKNKKQIVGAFDASNNDASGKFAIDVVQGDNVFVELNIEPNVNLDAIQLHVNRALVMHRGIEHLKKFITETEFIDQLDGSLNGRSSVCMINAICPQGSIYPNAKKATVQTVMITSSGAGLCSGTLVNNTGNTTSNCKARIMTATHCEASGTLTNADFDQYIIRFNFERSTCDNSGTTNGLSMTGVNVLSRSYLDSLATPDEIDGDFMIYEMRQAIPISYGAVLAGWNRSNSMPATVASPKKYIGFHHPGGDNKKVSISQDIYSLQNQTDQETPNGNRWFVYLDEGYAAPGSSGSGLFSGDGHFIGIASTAGEDGPPASCKVNSTGNSVYAMNFIYYQKLWHGWDYATDGNFDYRKIKPWLDPANTGVTALGAVSSTCAVLTTGGGTTTSINSYDSELENSFAVFPNPSFSDKIQLQFNLKESKNIKVSILDISGKEWYQSNLGKIMTETKTLNLSGLANGFYIIKVSSDNGIATKKLMLNR